MSFIQICPVYIDPTNTFYTIINSITKQLLIRKGEDAHTAIVRKCVNGRMTLILLSLMSSPFSLIIYVYASYMYTICLYICTLYVYTG